jgi:hypothetical protein
MSEAAWQAQVIELAKLHGWRVYHTYDSRRSNAGFPDLVCVKPGRLIVAELKRDGGRLTAEQQAWLAAFEAAGIEAWVWRPRDIAEVQAVLAGGNSSKR